MQFYPVFFLGKFGELVGLGRLGADLGYANLSGLDMDFTSGILEHTLAYRLWQAPFARQKFSPVFKYNDLASARRPLGEWRAIFEDLFATVDFEAYCLRGAGATFVANDFFKGK
jgi:hypothetical protein